MATLRGKNLKTVVLEIADGYVSVNPLFLKPMDAPALQLMLKELTRIQAEVRREKFPHGDPDGIRKRNVKLSRLNNAMVVLRNFARERKMRLG